MCVGNLFGGSKPSNVYIPPPPPPDPGLKVYKINKKQPKLERNKYKKDLEEEVY